MVRTTTHLFQVQTLLIAGVRVSILDVSHIYTVRLLCLGFCLKGRSKSKNSKKHSTLRSRLAFAQGSVYLRFYAWLNLLVILQRADGEALLIVPGDPREWIQRWPGRKTEAHRLEYLSSQFFLHSSVMATCYLHFHLRPFPTFLHPRTFPNPCLYCFWPSAPPPSKLLHLLTPAQDRI